MEDTGKRPQTGPGESPLGDLRDERIEDLDEERVPGVAGVFRLLHNVQVPMLRQLPDGLGVVGKEGGRRAQQPFVPRECRRVVSDRDAREQVELRGLNHASCSFLFTTRSSQTQRYTFLYTPRSIPVSV